MSNIKLSQLRNKCGYCGWILTNNMELLQHSCFSQYEAINTIVIDENNIVSIVVTTKVAPSRKHDTDRERPKDHNQDSENVLTTNEHDNAIKTGTLQQDFKNMIQMGFKSINYMIRK